MSSQVNHFFEIDHCRAYRHKRTDHFKCHSWTSSNCISCDLWWGSVWMFIAAKWYFQNYTSRTVRRPTVWTVHKESTRNQPNHTAQAYPDIHFSLPADFLFRESLLYTSILLRRNVSARISLRGPCILIWVDTLRRVHTLVFSWKG